MSLFDKVPMLRSLEFIRIRIRSILLVIFNIFLNRFVKHLSNLIYFVKFIGRPIQSCFGVISGNHYSFARAGPSQPTLGGVAKFFELKSRILQFFGGV
jgi:hypothetical protein